MSTNQQPGTVVKAIAVIAFTALIAFLVWLAVTLVAALPQAFSSLASLAEGIQQARPADEIVVANSNSIVNNGEAFTITWSNINRNGVYTIRYECTNGVALDMRYPANNITALPCGETVEIGSDVTSLELFARSEKKRFIDVPYSIGFMPSGEGALAYKTDTSFTVVNVNIPQSQSIATEDDDDSEPSGEVAGETTEDTTDDTVVETPDNAPPTPPAPVYETVEIYELPSSDPDGFVDLAVRFVGVGRLAVNNEFVRGVTITEGTRGAFQFEVRNLGTKTSDDWYFTADLPAGREYESPEYDGLLPNERTIITIGFDTDDAAGAHDFGATVTVDDDIARANNGFESSVLIRN